MQCTGHVYVDHETQTLQVGLEPVAFEVLVLLQPVAIVPECLDVSACAP